MALGDGHDRGVDEPEIEICVLRIELDGAPEEAWRHVRDRVVADGEGAKEQARRFGPDPVSHDVIDLDRHRIRNDEVSPEATDERRSQSMRRITTVDCRDERPGVRDDAQRFASASRRYSSARRLKSGGPSPEPT